VPLPTIGPQERLCDQIEAWLAGIVGELPAGLALVAVGGLGRRELTVFSDLDLLLLHAPGSRREADDTARRLWPQLRENAVSVEHSVRTVDECLRVASDDLAVTLGLLDARLVTGDPDLHTRLVEASRRQWRRIVATRLPWLRAAAEARAHRHGELAFLLEPDLRESHGGLRDGQLVRALAMTGFTDAYGLRQRDAYACLLQVRSRLHEQLATRGLRRREDRLLVTEQAAVAKELGLDGPDELLSWVSGAGRVLARALDRAWRTTQEMTSRGRVFSRRPLRARATLADGVVVQDGLAVLASTAHPESDPGLIVRVAAAAAQAGVGISEHTLARLGTETPAVPEPWPEEIREDFVSLLGAGRPMIAVMEDLDEAGLLTRLLPEWTRVRYAPQHNPFHSYTVDRHLMETVVQATRLVRGTARPDLLLLGALLHDIGKGGGPDAGDHSVAGAEIARGFAARIGLDGEDADTLVTMVRRHLVLPDTATGRDLDDPVTIEQVGRACGSVLVLELLGALAQADGVGTGPSAWTDWKATLVADLVVRVRRWLESGVAPPPSEQVEPPAALRDYVARGGTDLETTLAPAPDGAVWSVLAPDQVGLLAAAAGVAAINALEVRSAMCCSLDGRALIVLRVAHRFGRDIDKRLLHDELRVTLAGTFPLAERLARRRADYPRPRGHGGAAGTLAWIDPGARAHDVLEVRAPDEPGFLHQVAGAIASTGVSIRSAHCSTLGHEVVDVFYLATRSADDADAVTEAVQLVLTDQRARLAEDPA